MADYDSYLNRINVNGSTARERDKNIIKDNLIKNAPNLLSCKSVLINDVEQNLIVDTGTKPYYKIIKSLPDETFACGDYVTFSERNWLIINADNDSEIYTDGNMQECNYTLKWQNNNLDIIERHCCVMSASQYNSGEEATKTITVGYNQLLVYVTLDRETVNLKSDKRFFIDNEIINPKVYKLTRVDTVSMSYLGVGCVVLLFTEDSYNPSTDRIDLMLCDYKTADNPPVTTITITHSGKPQIRTGGSAKTFTAVSDYNIVLWEKICTSAQDSYVEISPDVNDYSQCKVKCLNNSLLSGSSFRLKCTDSRANTGELLINIVGGV